MGFAALQLSGCIGQLLFFFFGGHCFCDFDADCSQFLLRGYPHVHAQLVLDLSHDQPLEGNVRSSLYFHSQECSF